MGSDTRSSISIFRVTNLNSRSPVGSDDYMTVDKWKKLTFKLTLPCGERQVTEVYWGESELI